MGAAALGLLGASPLQKGHRYESRSQPVTTAVLSTSRSSTTDTRRASRSAGSSPSRALFHCRDKAQERIAAGLWLSFNTADPIMSEQSAVPADCQIAAGVSLWGWGARTQFVSDPSTST